MPVTESGADMPILDAALSLMKLLAHGDIYRGPVPTDSPRDRVYHLIPEVRQFDRRPSIVKTPVESGSTTDHRLA